MDDLSHPDLIEKDTTHCSLLIPAAGDSKRFSDAGVHKPKGLIRSKWRLNQVTVRNGTMIEHVVPIGWNGPVRVACKLDCFDIFKNELPKDYDVFPIASSLGQADTVVQACKDLRNDILVVNSDNGFSHDLNLFIDHCRESKASCGAVVFRSNKEPRYGYINSFPFFEYGIEKNPISSWALAGAFYFKNAATLTKAALLILSDPLIRQQEIYLSDLFYYVKGLKIAYAIPRDELYEWGTPVQLMKDKSLDVDLPELHG